MRTREMQDLVATAAAKLRERKAERDTLRAAAAAEHAAGHGLEEQLDAESVDAEHEAASDVMAAIEEAGYSIVKWPKRAP